MRISVRGISRGKAALRASVLLLVAVCTAQAASRLTNVSVRSAAGSDADTLIVGFTIAGGGSKPVLIRGIGPALGAFGIPDAVADPELRLFNSVNESVADNDSWSTVPNLAAASAAVGAFPLASGSGDAALLRTLPPGSYSTHIGVKNSPGTALVEVYDTDSLTSSAELTNVSARSFAGTGAAVLTVGFAISGDRPATVLIRAVGPTLNRFGVSGALANPQLRLFRGTDQLLENNDWLFGAGWDTVFSSVGAFGFDNNTRDSALVVSLPPGTYTAQAAGVNNTTGVALIEVYVVRNHRASTFVFGPVGGTNVDVSVKTNPVVLTQARPQYPFELHIAGLPGEAVVDFIVDVDGRVLNPFAIRATHPLFAAASVAAVRQWTFRPGRNATGHAVPTHMQVPIVFTLDG